MSDRLTIVVGALELPGDQEKFIEMTSPNEVDVETIDGALFTDFRNIRRAWSVGLLPLCRSDWESIYAIYRAQYTSEKYVTFMCSARGIHTTAKMNISDQDIRKNGDQIEGITLTFKEQYAVS